jgi:hypothetical protein
LGYFRPLFAINEIASIAIVNQFLEVIRFVPLLPA